MSDINDDNDRHDDDGKYVPFPFWGLAIWAFIIWGIWDSMVKAGLF